MLNRPCQWIHAEKKRYYMAQISQDLLGEWVVIQRWGSLGSRRGGHQHTRCASQAAVEAKLVQIARRRQSRRYQPLMQAEQ